MFEWSVAAGSFVVSVTLTGGICYYARRFGFIDHPNERSSHAVPTPRGGGLAIVAVVAGCLALLVARQGSMSGPLNALACGGLLIAVIGAVDDRWHVPSPYRLLVHTVAATFAVAMVGGLAPLPIGAMTIELGFPGDVLAVVFMVWFVNLFNFMDGIDGIATAEAIFIAGALLFLSYPDSSPLLALVLVSLACASAGFLVWNWSPAKIFLGDVGSGFLGFSLSTLAFSLALAGNISLWTALILAGVFVTDATVTLITRVLRGDRWYAAHRSHAYQRAARSLRSHSKVTIAVVFVNLLWLFPLASLSVIHRGWGWWLCLLAWAPLVILAIVLGAGRSD